MLGGIKNFVNSFVTPKPEDFYEKGNRNRINKGWLTPEQFVQAGNQITMSGWSWKKAPSSLQLTLDPPDA